MIGLSNVEAYGLSRGTRGSEKVCFYTCENVGNYGWSLTIVDVAV